MSDPDDTHRPNLTSGAPTQRTTSVYRPVLFVSAIACLTLGVFLSGYAILTFIRAIGHLRGSDVLGLLGVLAFGLALVGVGFFMDRQARRPAP